MLCSQEYPTQKTDNNMVGLTIPLTTKAEIYYSKFGQMDRHNSYRQEIIDIEKNVGY